MKKEVYILFTGGRGPLECGLAVEGVQNRFQEYLASQNVSFEIVSEKKGEIEKSIDTIVFKVLISERAVIDSWLGTIQWICKSPIRKSHKRKNWYIKCQEITMPNKIEINVNDVIVQTFKSSGPGGQHRNKVETAIRIIHKPSGINVTASDGKSQSQNKKKAWKKLEDKLKAENEKIQEGFNLEQWTSQIEIERGNPVKTFKTIKFT